MQKYRLYSRAKVCQKKSKFSVQKYANYRRTVEGAKETAKPEDKKKKGL